MLKKINEVFKFQKNIINNLGAISRKHVIEKFSKEMMLKKYYKFYQENI